MLPRALLMTALIVFVTKMVTALPDFQALRGVQVSETNKLDRMVTNASNPHIRFDTNRAFYAYAANYGKHHLDGALE